MLKHCDRRTTLQWAKFGSPLCGYPVNARGSVAALVRATGPIFAQLLHTNIHRVITVAQSNVIWL